MFLEPKGNYNSDPFRNRREFEKEYLNPFPPPTLLSWLDDLCRQLDVPPPDPIQDLYEFHKRLGAWETQTLILKKLRYAINYEIKNETEKERAIKNAIVVLDGLSELIGQDKKVISAIEWLKDVLK